MSQDAKRKMKVVIRHLPWSLPEDKFRELLSDSVRTTLDYFVYELGKQTTKRTVDSHCTMGFTDVERLHQFADAFNGKVFVDHKGREFACQVEFAMHQRTPKCRAPDPRKNTLLDDPEFQAFCRDLEQPPPPAMSAERWLEEREKEEKEGGASPLAPLVQELLERRRHFRRKARGGDWDEAPRRGGRRGKASRYGGEEDEEGSSRSKGGRKAADTDDKSSKRGEKDSKKEKEKEKEKGKKTRVADEWGYEDPSRWEDKAAESGQGSKKRKEDDWNEEWNTDRRGDRPSKERGDSSSWSRSGRWDTDRGYGKADGWDARWADPYSHDDWYGRGGGKDKGKGGWYNSKEDWPASRHSGRGWDEEWPQEWDWEHGSRKPAEKKAPRDREKEKGREREELDKHKEDPEREKRRERERAKGKGRETAVKEAGCEEGSEREQGSRERDSGHSKDRERKCDEGQGAGRSIKGSLSPMLAVAQKQMQPGLIRIKKKEGD
eukprot:GGOE01061999.1.p1 GENE.GGOE01061999.1~~GGOE01061999.1.p1  ORF type:complete len:491 (+),score=82.43 GGOE01061999.1:59-1531(+)